MCPTPEGSREDATRPRPDDNLRHERTRTTTRVRSRRRRCGVRAGGLSAKLLPVPAVNPPESAWLRFRHGIRQAGVFGQGAHLLPAALASGRAAFTGFALQSCACRLALPFAVCVCVCVDIISRSADCFLVLLQLGL